MVEMSWNGALPGSDIFTPMTLVEWKLSASAPLDWAASFLLAQTPSNGTAAGVRGGGPGISLDIVWWFVPTDEIETVDAEVKRRVAVANSSCGTDMSEQRIAKDIRARRNVPFRLLHMKSTDASDAVRSLAGRGNLPSFRWGAIDGSIVSQAMP